MTKKTGPALYELLDKPEGSREKAGFSMPRWWKSSDGTEGAPARSEPTLPGLVVPEKPASGSAESPSTYERGSRPPVENPVPGRMIDFAGGRLILALSSRATAVAVFILAVLAGVSFFLGHVRGKKVGNAEGFVVGRDSVASATADEIELARNAAPTEDELFVGVGESPLLRSMTPIQGESSEADSAEGKVAWIKGYTYVVVQDFKDSERDAVYAAQEFLAERGIETSVAPLKDAGAYRYRLVTNRGFNRRDPVQDKRLNEFWEDIKQLGKAFRKAGGRHNLEGFLYDLNRDQW